MDDLDVGRSHYRGSSGREHGVRAEGQPDGGAQRRGGHGPSEPGGRLGDGDLGWLSWLLNELRWERYLRSCGGEAGVGEGRVVAGDGGVAA